MYNKLQKHTYCFMNKFNNRQLFCEFQLFINMYLDSSYFCFPFELKLNPYNAINNILEAIQLLFVLNNS